MLKLYIYTNLQGTPQYSNKNVDIKFSEHDAFLK